jgi:hypothetical protein
MRPTVVLFLWWRSRIFVYRKSSSSTRCATSTFFERLFTQPSSGPLSRGRPTQSGSTRRLTMATATSNFANNTSSRPSHRTSPGISRPRISPLCQHHPRMWFRQLLAFVWGLHCAVPATGAMLLFRRQGKDGTRVFTVSSVLGPTKAQRCQAGPRLTLP